MQIDKMQYSKLVSDIITFPIVSWMYDVDQYNKELASLEKRSAEILYMKPSEISSRIYEKVLDNMPKTTKYMGRKEILDIVHSLQKNAIESLYRELTSM